MLLFNEIKEIIKQCSVKVSNNEGDKLHFSIDVKKLEKQISANESNLHILNLSMGASSKKVSLSDYQFIAEYIKDENDLKSLCTTTEEYCAFNIFSTVDGKGTALPKRYSTLTADQLYQRCNIEIDKNLVADILTKCPVYGVVVVRVFDSKKDKYKYNIYFRSNYHMINYYKSLNSAADTAGETKENV